MGPDALVSTRDAKAPAKAGVPGQTALGAG